MPEQDRVLAAVLKRLWRMPADPHPFRRLSAMAAIWRKRTLNDAARWPDFGLVEEGLDWREDSLTEIARAIAP